MSWNYSGNPGDSPRDKVRFLVGDTCEDQQLVSDGEIAWAVSNQPTEGLAAALVLRALAARFSRLVTAKVGDVSKNCGEMAKAFKVRADELDPSGMTFGAALLVLPKFGGLSISEKKTLDLEGVAVLLMFKKGQDDIPGGPDVHGREDDELLS